MKDRIRKLWNRYLCHHRGHLQVEITSYGRKGTTVGTGCTRFGCGEGKVVSHRVKQYPRPADPVHVRRVR